MNSAVVEGTDPERASSSRASQTWLEREIICDEIAEFIKRCLGGDYRGSSGRDRIHLPSKIWLVFKDYEGLEYRPVRVCRTWAACKELVKKAGSAGDSVFVGLPSEREACRVAGRSGVWLARWALEMAAVEGDSAEEAELVEPGEALASPDLLWHCLTAALSSNTIYGCSKWPPELQFSAF